ncbi:MAG: hypothetical protein ACD_9C00004G0003 [uncultured bacterium]|nr:MAG: hypothetical protein ACD_9C00004G0003 [uncultured bacterium]
MIDLILKPIKALLGLNPAKPKVKIKCEDEKCVLVVDKKDEILSVEDIYTPMSVAKEEIWRRWNDEELRKKVEDFLGGDIPHIFQENPKSFLVRHVTSPNKELIRFLDLNDCNLIEPFFLEFIDDKFTAKNSLKYALCKLVFHNGLGKKGGDKIESEKIVFIDRCEGKKFKEMKTVWDENFVDFHHGMLREILPNCDNSICDISEWLTKKGKKSEKFYLQYLALFVCHGILFENFLISGNEKKLTEETVIPAVRELERIFGLKPLIVPLLPIEDESDPYWAYYPEKLKKSVKG